MLRHRIIDAIKTLTRIMLLGCSVAAIAVGGHPETPPTGDIDAPSQDAPSQDAPSQEPSASILPQFADPNWTVDVVAAEPNVANVVAFDVNDRGEIYVAETYRQNHGVTDNRRHDQQWLHADLASKTVQNRIDYHRRLLGDRAEAFTAHEDRIRKLVDLDGDGVFDRSIIFADGFRQIEEGTGAGVLSVGDDVFYTCIPKLWKISGSGEGEGGGGEGQAGGNDVARTRQVLSDGYGVRVSLRGHDSRGPIVGPDGRLYFTIGDRGYHITTDDGRVLANPDSGAVFRCELDGSDLTVIATGLRNPKELAFNDAGDLFTVDNHSEAGDESRIVQILHGGDSGWRMHYQYLPDRGIFNREQIWKPIDDKQSVAIVPPVANFAGDPAGLTFYPGTGFGDQWIDQFLVCDFQGDSANSGVRSFRLERNGASYTKTDDAQVILKILATDVAFGPRGELFVSDWGNHWAESGKGRIYRFESSVRDQTVVDQVHRLLTITPSELASEQWAAHLSHRDRRVRQKSQFELARRRDVDRLDSVAASSQQSINARRAAIWGLGQIARREGKPDNKTNPNIAETTSEKASESEKDGETSNVGKKQKLNDKAVAALKRLFQDDDPEVVLTAVSTAGDSKSQRFAEAIATASHRQDPRVQSAVWIALGKLNCDIAVDTAAPRLAESDNRDPVLRHAAIWYWSKTATPDRLLAIAKENESFVRRCVIAALARIDAGVLRPFLSDPDPDVVAEAVRAIHDNGSIALTTAILKLSSGASLGDQNDETIRRIINTADRERSAEAAAALAVIASNESLDVDIRVSAIEQLGDWTGDRTIDLYDHQYRPRKAAKDDVAANVIRANFATLTAAPGPIKVAAIGSAARVGLTEIVPQLRGIASNGKQPGEDRVAALEGLRRLDPVGSADVARTIANDPKPTLAIAALAILKTNVDAHLDTFIAATSSADVRVRQTGWDAIAKSKNDKAIETLRDACQKFIDGTLDPTIKLDVIEAIEAFRDRLPVDLMNSFDRKMNAIESRTDAAKYESAMAGGDANAGKKAFFENTKLACVRCHQVDDHGGKVGPALTSIGADNNATNLIDAICDPDNAIAGHDQIVIVATESGETYRGVLVDQDDRHLTLTLADRSTVVIRQDEIVSRETGPSTMPNKVIERMDRRELRDLVAYLASLKTNRDADRTSKRPPEQTSDRAADRASFE